MTKTILSILAFCLATLSWGQSNEPFCCTKQGAELKYVTTDAKGKETQTSISKVDKVSGSNGNYEITITGSVYQRGELVAKPMTVTSTVVNGNASMALGGGTLIEISSDVPLIPSNLAVGQELATGLMKINALGIPVDYQISSNKVVGREEFAAPAGTFDCYIVEQYCTMKIGPIKSQLVQKIWYARGMGIIKQESFDKRGKLSTRMTLVEIAQ